MATTMPDRNGSGHLLRSDAKKGMAKAALDDVRKPEMTDDEERLMADVGKAVERVKGTLTLDQFADAIDRDARQVSRWIAGKEHPQIAAIFKVPAFRCPLLLALAEIVGVGVEIDTVIRVRRIG